MLGTFHYYAIGSSPTGAEGFEVLRTPLAVTRKKSSVVAAFLLGFFDRCTTLACLGERQQKKPPLLRGLMFWQGQKDSNPRHAVLETAALPTELYPYF